ncbi:MAG: aldose epimerase family protein [Blastococcus sp.]
MTDRQIRLQAGAAAAVIDPAAGGRLTSLVVDRHELLVQHGSDVFHWGSFPMAPWVGRLREARFEMNGRVVHLPVNASPHALHGLVTDRPWRVTACGESSVELAVDLGNRADPADPWPWPCRVTQSIVLVDDAMEFQLAVHASEPMPADIGWHPWFVRELSTGQVAIEAELEVHGGRIYENDAQGLPSGELGPPPPRPWDYCFVELSAPPTLRWPGLLELTVDSDCDHWVFYDMEPAGICAEPWTGPPNSLNGPERTIVTPARPLEATMRWAWRRLDA